MMKKIFFGFIVLISFFTYASDVRADCRDFINEAENITVKTENYIEKIEDKDYEDGVDDEDGVAEIVRINLIIEGLTENTYVVVINDYDEESQTFHYSDSDNGKIIVESPYIYGKVKFLVRTYVTDGSCSQDIIKNINKETPVFNRYSAYGICQTDKHLEICDPFYDNTGKSMEKFFEEANNELDYLNRTFLEKVWDFIKDYYLFMLIPVLIIGGIFVARIIILRRVNKNEQKQK